MPPAQAGHRDFCVGPGKAVALTVSAEALDAIKFGGKSSLRRIIPSSGNFSGGGPRRGPVGIGRPVSRGAFCAFRVLLFMGCEGPPGVTP